jgi:hypothetical protein
MNYKNPLDGKNRFHYNPVEQLSAANTAEIEGIGDISQFEVPSRRISRDSVQVKKRFPVIQIRP